MSLQFHLKFPRSPKFPLQPSSLLTLLLGQLRMEMVLILVGYPLVSILLLAKKAIAMLLIFCRPCLYFHHAPKLILIVYLPPIIVLILDTANHVSFSSQILVAMPKPFIRDPETVSRTPHHSPTCLQLYLLLKIIRISLTMLMRLLFLHHEV